MANKTVKIDGSGATVPEGTYGSILFVSSTGLLTEDNANLRWDDSGKILTINKISALGSISVIGSGGVDIADAYSTPLDAIFKSGDHFYIMGRTTTDLTGDYIVSNAFWAGIGWKVKRTGVSLILSFDAANARFDFYSNNAASAGNFAGTSNRLLSIPHIINAVNYLELVGNTTGNGAAVRANGTNTDVDLLLATKGTGGIKFYTDGLATPRLQFEVFNIPSAVNWIRVQGSATGGGPFIGPSVNSADPDINMQIYSKGLGHVKIMSGTGGVTLAQFTGFGAADRFLIFSASNGGNPSIDVSGGNLKLGGATDIMWGKPLVALGGGAAPTFGTIGGSGPTAAAQNTWMRLLDSAGAAFWVPAWK